MVDIEFEKIDSRVVVRLLREYHSETLKRAYMTPDLILVVSEAHVDDFKADFRIYSELSETEQRSFLSRLRILPHYTGRLLDGPEA